MLFPFSALRLTWAFQCPLLKDAPAVGHGPCGLAEEEGREVRLDTSTVSTAPDNLKEDGDQGWGA